MISSAPRSRRASRRAGISAVGGSGMTVMRSRTAWGTAYPEACSSAMIRASTESRVCRDRTGRMGLVVGAGGRLAEGMGGREHVEPAVLERIQTRSALVGASAFKQTHVDVGHVAQLGQTADPRLALLARTYSPCRRLCSARRGARRWSAWPPRAAPGSGMARRRNVSSCSSVSPSRFSSAAASFST